MPLMRIRSVEIVFEDDMSTCTDTGLLDRDIELVVSDSDDSTKCVDELEQLQGERDDSVTLNADADLSDDNSFSKDALVEVPNLPIIQISDETHDPNDSPIVKEDITLSINISELGDSGRFTEEASSSRVDRATVTLDDAALARSFDSVNAERMKSTCARVSEEQNRLYEYIDSDSDSSDTAVCDEEHPGGKHVSLDTNSDDTSLCESYDLQYDSFVDIGKF